MSRQEASALPVNGNDDGPFVTTDPDVESRHSPVPSLGLPIVPSSIEPANHLIRRQSAGNHRDKGSFCNELPSSPEHPMESSYFWFAVNDDSSNLGPEKSGVHRSPLCIEGPVG